MEKSEITTKNPSIKQGIQEEERPITPEERKEAIEWLTKLQKLLDEDNDSEAKRMLLEIKDELAAIRRAMSKSLFR